MRKANTSNLMAHLRPKGNTMVKSNLQTVHNLFKGGYRVSQDQRNKFLGSYKEARTNGAPELTAFFYAYSSITIGANNA